MRLEMTWAFQEVSPSPGSDSFWNESWSGCSDFADASWRLAPQPGSVDGARRALCQAWEAWVLGVYRGGADAILVIAEKEWGCSDIRGKWANPLKIKSGHSIQHFSFCQCPHPSIDQAIVAWGPRNLAWLWAVSLLVAPTAKGREERIHWEWSEMVPVSQLPFKGFFFIIIK